MKSVPKCKICKEPATRKRGLASLCSSLECELQVKLAEKPVKKKAPKKRAGHDKSMLNACRGQACYLQAPGCRSYPGDPTVVPAHRNENKGMGLKNSDELTVPGCFECHIWLDQGKATREEKRALWDNAYELWKADRRIK